MIGGYGGFGARVSRRLAGDGHDVIVAGRSAEKARRFCNGAAGLTPLTLDRAELPSALVQLQPQLVVDASGPFQAMDYGVAEACIAARVHYCDIADSRAFVCGMAILDEAAKQAGVVLMTGASSVPALSGAAVRMLSAGMDDITAVELAISASNRATAGPAVAEAILGQVGQPIKLMRAGRWTGRFGWQEMTRLTFALPGEPPIRDRLVGLADVPDNELLPHRLPGHPAVSFRAGAELAIQNRSLWLGSWLVRLGIMRSLSGLARIILPLQALGRGLGSDRSAMLVRLFGTFAGTRVERRWTLIADDGDGPEIPALSVPIVARRILAGMESPGARDAGLCLNLNDYQPAFDGLAIRHSLETIESPPPLYRQVLQGRFDDLSPAVREMHQVCRDKGASGEATVLGATNTPGRLISRLMRFPPPGRYSLHVGMAVNDAGVETWTRDFGGHRFSSQLSRDRRLLVERFGPMRFGFELAADAGCLEMRLRRWSAFGLRLPLAFGPKTYAREREQHGRFRFDVEIGLPLVGRLVRYEGLLSPIR